MRYALLALLIICMGLAAPAAALKLPGSDVTIVTASGQKQVVYKELHALVVGAGDYKSYPASPGAVAEAREVADTLKFFGLRMGYQVTFLENPTSSQLRKALKQLTVVDGARPDRALLFYYAGRTATLTDSDGKKVSYILPIDCPLHYKNAKGFSAKALSLAEIENLASQAKAGQFLLLFDANITSSGLKFIKPAPRPITEESARPIRQYIFAGSPGSVSPPKSVFKDKFLEAIKGGADINGDKMMTGLELGLFMQAKVSQATSGMQVPVFGLAGQAGLARGDFLYKIFNPIDFDDLPRPKLGGAGQDASLARKAASQAEGGAQSGSSAGTTSGATSSTAGAGGSTAGTGASAAGTAGSVAGSAAGAAGSVAGAAAGVAASTAAASAAAAGAAGSAVGAAGAVAGAAYDVAKATYEVGKAGYRVAEKNLTSDEKNESDKPAAGGNLEAEKKSLADRKAALEARRRELDEKRRLLEGGAGAGAAGSAEKSAAGGPKVPVAQDSARARAAAGGLAAGAAASGAAGSGPGPGAAARTDAGASARSDGGRVAEAKTAQAASEQKAPAAAFGPPLVTLRTDFRTYADELQITATERKATEMYKELKKEHPEAFDKRFVDNGDGTVTDRVAGLVWEKGFSDKNASDFAEHYAQRANENQLGGGANWRLPTTEELVFLYLDSEGDPARVLNFPEVNTGLWTADKCPTGLAYVRRYKTFFSKGMHARPPTGSADMHQTKAVRSLK